MMMMMTMMMMMKKKKMMMIMKWTNRYEKKKLLLGKDRRERERNTSAAFARRCFSATKLAEHMRIHTNEKPYECDKVRKLFVNLVICKVTCVLTRTRNRMNVMCARRDFVNLNI